jgi:restriction system protein
MIFWKKTAPARFATEEPPSEHCGEGDTCPKCGDDLMLRAVKNGSKTGSTFIGCSTFPSCRFTRST